MAGELFRVARQDIASAWRYGRDDDGTAYMSISGELATVLGDEFVAAANAVAEEREREPNWKRPPAPSERMAHYADDDRVDEAIALPEARCGEQPPEPSPA